MADDLSLLFKLRADNVQAKTALAETRAAVTSLRSSFGSDLTQMQGAARTALADIGSHLNVFVGERIPLVGGAFLRVTENLRGLGSESAKGEKELAHLNDTINNLANATGKTRTEVTTFLQGFVHIESQSQADAAAVGFLGTALAEKLIPELEKTAVEFEAVAGEAAVAKTAIEAFATPVGLVVLAIGALVVVSGAVVAGLVAIAKSAAESRGKLIDLSQQTGISVETLSALEIVAKTTGGSIEGIVASLDIFQRKLEEADDPTSKTAILFHKLNVEVSDTETTLRDTLTALAKMPVGFQQTAAALDLFGRGGKNVLAILKETKGDLDGTIAKLRELGVIVSTEDARAADEFNDQLVLIDAQLTELKNTIGQEVIPVVLDALRQFSAILKDNKEAISALGTIVGFVAKILGDQLKNSLTEVNAVLIVAKPILDGIAVIYERIAQAVGFIVGHPISSVVPGAGTATPTPTTPSAEPSGDISKRIKAEIESRKELQGVLNFAFDEEKRRAESAIAQAQRDFEAGNSTRKQELDSVIANTKAKSKAEIDALEVERKIKLTERGLNQDDVAKQRELSNQIIAIDSQIADKKAKTKQFEADERAKFQKKEQEDEIAHQERLLAASQKLDQVNIKGIEQQVALRTKAAFDGDREIENIELTAIDREQNLLVKRLEIAGQDLAKRREIQDQINVLDTQRTATEQAHQEQRLQIAQREGDIILSLIQVKGNAQIAAIQALANARVFTEEQAEKKIAKIRLDGLDAEIALAKARGQDTRVLEAQRVALQAQTERDIEDGRQRDLANERKYAEDLKKIGQQIVNVQRETARLVIESMIQHFASRAAIIRAQVQFDIDDENARHRNAETAITNLRKENLESKKTAEEKLETIRELNRLEEAEAQRHRLALQGITSAGKAATEREDPTSTRSLFGDSFKENFDTFKQLAADAGKPISDLSAGFKALAQTSADTFAQMSKDQGNFGSFAKEAFGTLAQGIGQIVESYVLLGTAGPNALRKLLAQVLAHLAAEASVKAIFELAEGFALLFVNPAAAGAHFTAAAIYGSVAGVAAIAGRKVAGDLFKQPASSSSGSPSANSPQQLNPLTLNRDQPQRVLIEFKVNDSEFGRAITGHIVKDVQQAGPIREVIANDGIF